jgi:hypothetical protein
MTETDFQAPNEPVAFRPKTGKSVSLMQDAIPSALKYPGLLALLCSMSKEDEAE